MSLSVNLLPNNTNMYKLVIWSIHAGIFNQIKGKNNKKKS
jgi:hypothetical protein